MIADWLIIDGNNLVHQMPTSPGRPFDAARSELARLIDEVGGVLARRVTVVFDGTRAGGTDAVFDASSVEVIFSPAHRTADDVIERMVSQVASQRDVVVVTSDRAERDTVMAAGGEVMSCARFLDELEVQRNQMSRTIQTGRRPESKPTLGAFFPKMLLLWGTGLCLWLAFPVGAPGHGAVHERIAYVTDQIGHDVRNGELYLRRAVLYLEHGDAGRALEDLDTAVGLGSRSVDGPVLRARALAMLGRESDALDVLDAHLNAMPNEVGAYLLRAELNERASRSREAAADYARAIEHANPPKPDYYQARVRCLQQCGQTNAALQCLQEGLARIPESTVLQLYAYELALATGRYADALTAVEGFLAQTRRQERWLARKGDVLQKLGQMDAARESYQAALRAIASLPQRHQNTTAMRLLADETHRALQELGPCRVGSMSQ